MWTTSLGKQKIAVVKKHDVALISMAAWAGVSRKNLVKQQPIVEIVPGSNPEFSFSDKDYPKRHMHGASRTGSQSEYAEEK
jgi:hypothetical protein